MMGLRKETVGTETATEHTHTHTHHTTHRVTHTDRQTHMRKHEVMVRVFTAACAWRAQQFAPHAYT
jgi:hypothetical protein